MCSVKTREIILVCHQLEHIAFVYYCDLDEDKVTFYGILKQLRASVPKTSNTFSCHCTIPFENALISVNIKTTGGVK